MCFTFHDVLSDIMKENVSSQAESQPGMGWQQHLECKKKVLNFFCPNRARALNPFDSVGSERRGPGWFPWIEPLISPGKRNQRTCLLVYDAWREQVVPSRSVTVRVIHRDWARHLARSESFTVTGELEGTWHGPSHSP
jgi:hypothetical protein